MRNGTKMVTVAQLVDAGIMNIGEKFFITKHERIIYEQPKEFLIHFRGRTAQYQDCVNENGVPLVMLYSSFSKLKNMNEQNEEGNENDETDSEEEDVKLTPLHKRIRSIKKPSRIIYESEDDYEEMAREVNMILPKNKPETEPTKKRKLEDTKNPEYQKQISRLFQKNSVISKIDLHDILSFEVFTKLTEDEQRELSKDLPSIDVADGIATQQMFKNFFFLESVRQLRDIIEEGYLHPSRNFLEEIQQNQLINAKNGTCKEGIDSFWLREADKLDMSWIREL